MDNERLRREYESLTESAREFEIDLVAYVNRVYKLVEEGLRLSREETERLERAENSFMGGEAERRVLVEKYNLDLPQSPELKKAIDKLLREESLGL